MEVIISAGITGAVTLCVCLISSHYQNNTTRTLIEYRLLQLETEVKKHNGLIDRTYKLEDKANVQEEKIKVANNRIDDLERAVS